MGRAITRTLQKNSFWLAMILHLLIFFAFTYLILPKSIKDDNQELNIPSYLYHEESTPAVAHQESPVKPNIAKKPKMTLNNNLKWIKKS